MQRGNIFMRVVFVALVALASVATAQTATPEESPVLAVATILTPTEKAETSFLRGNAEADKVMCNGVTCPEGEMCMRGSGAPYCMKMRV